MWFRLDGEPEEVLTALARGSLDDAERLWSVRFDTAETAESGQQTMFNLAVLCHWRALVGTPSHEAAVIDAYATLWRDALQRWLQVLPLPQTGAYVEALCSGMSDPRIDAAFLAQLQAELPAAILRVNLELANAAGAAGSVPLASLHVQLVEESGFAPQNVATSMDALFAPLLTPIRSLLQPLVSGSTQLTQDVDFNTMREHYMRGRSRLVALGAKARLAAIAEEAVAAGLEKMLKETNALYFRIDGQIDDFWNDIGYYIKVWNELLVDHNRGYSRSGQLREVHRHVADDVTELLDDFDTAVDKFAEAMRRERVGLTFLTLLDEDAASHRAGEIATRITEEDDALSRVLSWKSEARAWLTKEEANMRQCCSTLY